MAGAMRPALRFNVAQRPTAERFAMSKKSAEHISALDPLQRGDGPNSVLWGGRSNATTRAKDRAIELAELALKSLNSPEASPAELKQYVLSLLLHFLANYNGGRVC